MLPICQAALYTNRQNPIRAIQRGHDQAQALIWSFQLGSSTTSKELIETPRATVSALQHATSSLHPVSSFPVLLCPTT